MKAAAHYERIVKAVMEDQYKCFSTLVKHSTPTIATFHVVFVFLPLHRLNLVDCQPKGASLFQRTSMALLVK